jgi:hypothetical protein
MGWRLPTVEEAASLLDPTQTAWPTLPEGHPFVGVVASSVYWTMTTVAGTSSDAWYVYFGTGTTVDTLSKTELRLAWCVRGGHGHDGR